MTDLSRGYYESSMPLLTLDRALDLSYLESRHLHTQNLHLWTAIVGEDAIAVSNKLLQNKERIIPKYIPYDLAYLKKFQEEHKRKALEFTVAILGPERIEEFSLQPNGVFTLGETQFKVIITGEAENSEALSLNCLSSELIKKGNKHDDDHTKLVSMAYGYIRTRKDQVRTCLDGLRGIQTHDSFLTRVKNSFTSMRSELVDRPRG